MHMELNTNSNDLNAFNNDPHFNSSRSFFKSSIQGISGKVKQPYIYDSEFQMKSINDKDFSKTDYRPLETILYSNQFMAKEDWNVISKSLVDNPSYNTIVMSGVNLDNYGLKMLGDICRQNSCIKNLQVEWNYLNEYPTEFDYFCDALSRSKVAYLSMNNNKINTTLAGSIANLIKNSPSLMYLDLRWNEIGNEGAKLITSSLMKNNSLQELNLIGNKINEDCLREITDYIRKNKMYAKVIYNVEEEVILPQKRSASPPPNFDEKNNIVPLKILEKEKEISDEFKARYDVQLIANAKLENRNRELEKLLEIERGKVLEAKTKYDNELQKEKDSRIKNEEMIVLLKEKNSKLSIEKAKTDNENEVKLLAMQTEIQNLNNSIRILRESNERTVATNEEKLELIKTEYEKNYTHLASNIEDLKYENEKVKREYSDEIKSNIKDFEKKVKSLEENLKILRKEKEELEKEMSFVKKSSLNEKIELEMTYKTREAKLVQEEASKGDSNSKAYEKKIKLLEETCEDLNMKHANLLQEFSNFKKTSCDDQIKYENKLSTLGFENSSVIKQSTGLTSELNKITLEIKSKDGIISKLRSQLNDTDKRAETMERSKKEILSKKDSDLEKERSRYETEKGEMINKMKEMEAIIELLKIKLNRIENDVPRISDNLKKAMFTFIDNN